MWALVARAMAVLQATLAASGMLRCVVHLLAMRPDTRLLRRSATQHVEPLSHTISGLVAVFWPGQTTVHRTRCVAMHAHFFVALRGGSKCKGEEKP